jgi:hypothetical protein
MTPCFQIVEAIKNHTELLEEVNVKLSVLHIAMMRHYVYSRPELEHCLTSHLQQQQINPKHSTQLRSRRCLLYLAAAPPKNRMP